MCGNNSRSMNSSSSLGSLQALYPSYGIGVQAAYASQLQQAYAAQLQQAYLAQLAYAAQLNRSLQSIYQASNISPAQQQSVSNSLSPLFSGSNAPSNQALGNLGDDLSTIVAAGKVTPKQATRLSQDAAAVLNAATSRSALDNLRSDLRSLRKSGKLKQDELQLIADDVNAIIRPIVPNGLKVQ
jgi:hypothetical protein